MTSVPLGSSDWRRGISTEPDILLKNRYFETNPTNLVEQTALLSRPGLKKWLEVGDGPIRSIYSQPGSFEDALFVVSADTLYRIDTDETITEIYSPIGGANDESPSLAATAQIGAVPAYLYIADGEGLFVYDGATTAAVTTPDGVGIISVGVIASFVICIVSPGNGLNGRFYWIEPAAITIDPINFATAERTPDPLYSIRVVGDQFWLLGTNSVEIWYATGDGEAPFARTSGRVFDRGVWGGTDFAIGNSIMVVDSDGVVYRIVDGSPQRISNHGIEERIRKAMKDQLTGA